MSFFINPPASRRRNKKQLPPINAPTDALLDECYRGRTNRILQLIEDGADVNAKDFNSETPLTISSGLNHVEVTRLLLQNGAAVDIENKNGGTALWEACRGGYVQVCEILLEFGAMIEVENRRSGGTALWKACQGGHVNLVQLLLDHGADPNQPNWTTGETPLLVACDQKKWDVVLILLQHDRLESVLEKTIHDETPLHLVTHAINRGNNRESRQQLITIVNKLLDMGDQSFIDEVDWSGKTALHIACSHDEEDLSLLRLLLDRGAKQLPRENGWTPLLQCCGLANFRACQLLLQNGANPNDTTSDGWTPLLLFASASRYHRHAIRELVVEYGADVNATRCGLSSLYHICCKGDREIARLLLDYGADIHHMTAEQVDPIHCACFYGHASLVRVLLECGASLESKRDDNIAPCHVAAAMGFVEQVPILAHYKADMNARSSIGLTPLFYACMNGHARTARALLLHGANVELRCKGETPLFSAFRKVRNAKDAGLVELLLDMGASVDAPVKRGTTLLQMACLSSGAPMCGTDTALTRNNGSEKKIPNFVQLFLERGASKEQRNNCGWQAMHFVAARGDCSTLELLLLNEEKPRKATLVNAQTQKGSTPLHIACQLGRPYLVSALLAHGAFVDLRNSNGKVALEAALVGRDHTCIFLLLQRLMCGGSLKVPG